MARLNSDLKNLLDSTQIATVFLDDALRIKHYTPVMEQLFSLRDVDRGRPITDFVSQLAYDELRADVQKVQRTLGIVERELDLKGGAASFLMRIRPYRTISRRHRRRRDHFRGHHCQQACPADQGVVHRRTPAPHPQPSCRRAVDFRRDACRGRLACGLRCRVQQPPAGAFARAGIFVTPR